jgi:hypothetical protein
MLSFAERSRRRGGGSYPGRLEAPAGGADYWPDGRAGICDVPGCGAPQLRHLPVCRDHAAPLPDWLMEACHDAVEDHNGPQFEARERELRDLAIKAAEVIG